MSTQNDHINDKSKKEVKYQLKSNPDRIVTAFQWLNQPGTPIPGAVYTIVCNQHVLFVRATSYTTELYHRLAYGDWLVTEKNGWESVLSDKEFTDAYRKVEDPLWPDALVEQMTSLQKSIDDITRCLSRGDGR